MKNLITTLFIITINIPNAFANNFTLQDYKNIKVGTPQKSVHNKFGKPQATLSGLYGDIYMVESTKAIIYYEFAPQKGFPVIKVIFN